MILGGVANQFATLKFGKVGYLVALAVRGSSLKLEEGRAQKSEEGGREKLEEGRSQKSEGGVEGDSMLVI